MAMQKIKKDDEVIVLTGRDRGKRGKVLRALRNGPESAAMVGAATGYEFSPIHHTLRKLRDLGLVIQREDDGRWELTDAGRANIS